MKRFALLVCLSVGCAAPAPTLNTSSPAAVNASVDRMAESLPPERREAFKRAMVLRTFPAAMKGEPLPPVLKDWDGLTAEEIILRTR